MKVRNGDWVYLGRCCSEGSVVLAFRERRDGGDPVWAEAIRIPADGLLKGAIRSLFLLPSRERIRINSVFSGVTVDLVEGGKTRLRAYRENEPEPFWDCSIDVQDWAGISFSWDAIHGRLRMVEDSIVPPQGGDGQYFLTFESAGRIFHDLLASHFSIWDAASLEAMIGPIRQQMALLQEHVFELGSRCLSAEGMLESLLERGLIRGSASPEVRKFLEEARGGKAEKESAGIREAIGIEPGVGPERSDSPQDVLGD
jgi:hypothetical protein